MPLKGSENPEFVLKAGHECTLLWRKSTNEREEKPEQKFCSEQSLELASVIKEASRNFRSIFSL
jgi:hypothetical protein